MRGKTIGWMLGVLLSASTAASAYEAYDPANCNGVDWNDKHAMVVSKVTAARANFVKSPYDDDFKAESCPAATDACRKTSFLVAGNLVLTGKTRGEFTCVVYQSPTAMTRGWFRGWLPSAALAPVAPTPAPKEADWTGTWDRPDGRIAIAHGNGGKLSIVGEMVVPTGRSAHTGDIEAEVTPDGNTIAFVDDGSTPFDKTDEGTCRVRMQRFGAWLVVEDNEGCGGAGVTFTGFYHRRK